MENTEDNFEDVSDDFYEEKISNIERCLRLEKIHVSDLTNDIGQQQEVFTEMLNNMRKRAIGNSISVGDYCDQLLEAKRLIQSMQYELQGKTHGKMPSAHWSDDDEVESSNDLWWHIDRPLDKINDDEVTPKINRQFIETTGEYFRNPFLQADTLDKICIDAIIYSEYYLYIDYVRERGIYKKRRKKMEKPFRYFFLDSITLITLAVLFLSLMTFLFNFDKHIFLLSGLGTGMYYLAKKIWPEKMSGKLNEKKLINDYMIVFDSIYHTCKLDFNSQMLWELCRSAVAEKGVGFPSVLYDLLQRQCQIELMRYGNDSSDTTRFFGKKRREIL